MFKSKYLVFILIAVCFTIVNAQETQKSTDKTPSVKNKRMLTFTGSDVAMLVETSSVIAEEEGKTIVKFIPPARAIPKEYQSLDLKVNDQIIFVNGKKVKKLSDFKEVYNKTKIGEEIELGIKRDDERFFVKFPKMDPSKAKGMMQMKTIRKDKEEK